MKISTALPPAASLSLDFLLCLKGLITATFAWRSYGDLEVPRKVPSVFTSFPGITCTGHRGRPFTSLPSGLWSSTYHRNLGCFDHCSNPGVSCLPSSAYSIVCCSPSFLVDLSPSHRLMYYISVHTFVLCHSALECRLSEDKDFFFSWFYSLLCPQCS